MTSHLSRLGTNQRLALAALVLGALAIFARPVARASVDPRELAMAVQRGFDRVQPRELAGWIIKGRSDYRLIDLREEAAFAAYHIPAAENVAFAALPDAGLARNETIVLCSEDGTRAGQAWVVLKAQRFKAVYILDRGLEGWKQEVLFPALAENAATPTAQAENERLRQVATYFGGAPRAAGATPATTATPAVVPAAAPKIDVPSLPGGAGKPAVKKKEGC